MVLNNTGYAIVKPCAQTLIQSAVDLDNLIDKIYAALIRGGWQFNSFVTNGRRLLGTSPQGLKVFLDLTKDTPFGYQTLCINLKSLITGIVSPRYVLDFRVEYSWRVISYPCGFFISRPGVHGDARGSAICGGIPRTPTNCSLDLAQGVSDVWFSFGDGLGPGVDIAANPRINIDDGVKNIFNQFGSYNGHAAPINNILRKDSPQILRLSSAGADSGTPGCHPTLITGEDIVYPAFISWPNPLQSPHIIRGQIYNAAIWSSSRQGDQAANRDGYDWISYTDAYTWGTLMLLTTTPISLGNVAF